MPPYSEPDDLEALTKPELIRLIREQRDAARDLELLDTAPLLLGVRDAAGMLGVSVSSVRRMVDKGTIPHFQMQGGQPRFSRNQIEAWLREHAAGGQE
jgi:excisionase family DNA binding protein